MTNKLNRTDNLAAEEAAGTETRRLERLVEINTAAGDREALAARHGRIWDTRELASEFEVLGFMAPFVVVRRKVDGRLGSLEFQHQPRFYFNFHSSER